MATLSPLDSRKLAACDLSGMAIRDGKDRHNRCLTQTLRSYAHEAQRKGGQMRNSCLVATGALVAGSAVAAEADEETALAQHVSLALDP